MEENQGTNLSAVFLSLFLFPPLETMKCKKECEREKLKRVHQSQNKYDGGKGEVQLEKKHQDAGRKKGVGTQKSEASIHTKKVSDVQGEVYAGKV